MPPRERTRLFLRVVTHQVAVDAGTRSTIVLIEWLLIILLCLVLIAVLLTAIALIADQTGEATMVRHQTHEARLNLPREDTRHAIVGLEGKLSDAPVVSPHRGT